MTWLDLTAINYYNMFFGLFILQSIQEAIARMVMFVWWEAPISMRAEWRCASMTSGEQCVMTSGTTLMLLWSASNWDMEVCSIMSAFLIHVDNVC